MMRREGGWSEDGADRLPEVAVVVLCERAVADRETGPSYPYLYLTAYHKYI
jgi:hypothetical protein